MSPMPWLCCCAAASVHRPPTHPGDEHRIGERLLSCAPPRFVSVVVVAVMKAWLATITMMTIVVVVVVFLPSRWHVTGP
jgi:hypothetical protein